jgi:hypothetical protein
VSLALHDFSGLDIHWDMMVPVAEVLAIDERFTGITPL